MKHENLQGFPSFPILYPFLPPTQKKTTKTTFRRLHQPPISVSRKSWTFFGLIQVTFKASKKAPYFFSPKTDLSGAVYKKHQVIF